jgi:hypothetical protein
LRIKYGTLSVQPYFLTACNCGFCEKRTANEAITSIRELVSARIRRYNIDDVNVVTIEITKDKDGVAISREITDASCYDFDVTISLL